jgi:hypothetical protein
MITETSFQVPLKLLQTCIDSLPNIDYRLTLNKSSGDFFYDPWIIRDEFKDTVWEEILNSLPGNQGEARLIKLLPKDCYMCHADLDDRWHLSLTGNQSYLIDLSDAIMHKLEATGKWHEMDAGKLHTASNFGEVDRVQLVVRKLLINPDAKYFINVKIVPVVPRFDIRYQFDQTISPWLNKHIKAKDIAKVSIKDNIIYFKLNPAKLENLTNIVKPYFQVVVSKLENS